MAIEVVIFDCDGVLVDSEDIANEQLRRGLELHGLSMTLEQVMESFVGLSMSSVVDKVNQMLGREVSDDFLDDLQVKTFAAFQESLKPVAGIKQVLDSLSTMPHRICVASSGSFEKMNLTLGMTGLENYFQGRIFNSSQVKRGKPYPDLYLYAANQMMCDPAQCLVIEDSVPGVQGAVAAGMEVLAYSVRGQDRLLATAGGMVFSDMGDILKYLE